MKTPKTTQPFFQDSHTESSSVWVISRLKAVSKVSGCRVLSWPPVNYSKGQSHVTGISQWKVCIFTPLSLVNRLYRKTWLTSWSGVDKITMCTLGTQYLFVVSKDTTDVLQKNWKVSSILLNPLMPLLQGETKSRQGNGILKGVLLVKTMQHKCFLAWPYTGRCNRKAWDKVFVFDDGGRLTQS